MPERKRKPLADKTFRPANWKSVQSTGTAHYTLPKNSLPAASDSTKPQRPKANRATLLPQQPPTTIPSRRTAASLPFSRTGRESPTGIPLRSPLDDWSPADLAVLKNLGDMGLEWELVALEMQAQTPARDRSAEECRERYARMHMRVSERMSWEGGSRDEERDGEGEIEFDGGWDGEGVGREWGNNAFEPAESPRQVIGHLGRVLPFLPTVPTLPSQLPLQSPFRIMTYPPQALTFVDIPTNQSPLSSSPATSNFALYSSVPNTLSLYSSPPT